MGNNFVALFIIIKIATSVKNDFIIDFVLSYPSFHSLSNANFDHLVHFLPCKPPFLCAFVNATGFMPMMSVTFAVNIPIYLSVGQKYIKNSPAG